MRILVTGATGFLGSRTLEQLSALSEIESIVATGRTIKSSHFIEHEKVDYKLGDLSDPSFVDELVKDRTHIIHTAALSSPWGRYEEFYRANVLTQVNLIGAAQKYGIKRFVNVSSPSIYFELKDKLKIKESDPLPSKFINAYAATKREAEQMLESSSVPFISLRPRALIGRGDTVIMPRLIRAYDEGNLKIIGDGKNVVDLTAVANVVHAIELSLKASDHALNRSYNISNGEPVNLWDSIADILSKLGRTPPTKKVPFTLVKYAAKIMEIKSRMTNLKEPVLTEYGVGTLSKSFTMDISEARTKLGYEPQVSVNEAIDEFVEWYKQNEKN